MDITLGSLNAHGRRPALARGPAAARWDLADISLGSLLVDTRHPASAGGPVAARGGWRTSP